MSEIFLVSGALLELLGIILVVSPDLVPWGLRLVRWMRPRWRQIENRVRRRLGLAARGIAYEDSATVEMKLTISASGEVDFDPNASLDEKVAFLLRRSVESQSETNALAQRVSAIEQETPNRIAELRAELEAHVARALETAREDYRVARITGAFVLAAGLTLVTVASLL